MGGDSKDQACKSTDGESIAATSTVSGDSKDQACKSTDGESIAATSIFLEDMHSFRLPALPYKTLL